MGSEEGDAMAERVVVHMDANFGAYFTVSDPENGEEGEARDVTQLHQLTPYGMLLASLGTCTAMVVQTYAGHHALKLDAVELVLEFGRSFADDCEHCEEIDTYEEVIREELIFHGQLSDADVQKLFRVSHQCPINKLLQAGTKIDSRLAATHDQ
jgi:uncharacterized OsmC-like protein